MSGRKKKLPTPLVPHPHHPTKPLRVIEILHDRHVSDLMECGATIEIADSHVRCNATAVKLVRIDDVEDYVCQTHLSWLEKEKEAQG